MADPCSFLEKSSPEKHDEIVLLLAGFQEQYELPPEEEFNKVTPFSLGTSIEDVRKRIRHMTEVTVLTIQLIVQFSKKIPGFDCISIEDRINLLKAHAGEIMMLRAARRYDPNTNSIVFGNNQPYTKDNFHFASMGEYGEAIFKFCQTMWSMRVNNGEYALLTAIVTFSNSPNLNEPLKVKKICTFYYHILRHFIRRYRPSEGVDNFTRLLSIIPKLKALSDMNIRQCSNPLYRNQLPPLIEELWGSMH